jgi:hypothetical protein
MPSTTHVIWFTQDDDFSGTILSGTKNRLTLGGARTHAHARGRPLEERVIVPAIAVPKDDVSGDDVAGAARRYRHYGAAASQP